MQGQTEVSKGELVSSVEHTSKTVENCLAKAVAAKHPEICRVRRGKYKLAPRIQETHKNDQAHRGKKLKTLSLTGLLVPPLQPPVGGSGLVRIPRGGTTGIRQNPLHAMTLKEFPPTKPKTTLSDARKPNFSRN